MTSRSLPAVLLLLATVVLHAEPAPLDQAQIEKMKATLQSLQFQEGQIDLHNGVAKLNVPQELRYLNPTDTEKVLVTLWGNPPLRKQTLGMLMPSNMSPVQDDAWAVIIEGYEEDGYVKDDDAAKLDYDELLKTLQEQAKAANNERLKHGYPAMELVGWATPPRYDADAKKLYWAKEYKVAGSPEHTLNYNIRILGRRGTLVLNAIAGVSQLPDIQQATPTILSSVDFQEGHRYADFNPATDKVATYGIAALVAGGVLSKAGFFKALLAALVAGKKFVVIGVVALAALLKKVFTRKTETPI